MKSRVYSQWERNKDRAFLDMLDFNSNSEVIDLGCGSGDFSVRIREKIGCSKIWGIDVSNLSPKNAKKRGLLFKKADLNNHLPLESNFFDVVTSNQVIEHLFYPVTFMKEILRILKPGAYAVISTENLSSWDNIASLIFGYTPFSMEFDFGLRKIGNPWSPHEKELNADYDYPHVRIFAWDGLIELARFLSLNIEKLSGSGHIIGNVGEILDKRHCRFINLKLRKIKHD